MNYHGAKVRHFSESCNNFIVAFYIPNFWYMTKKRGRSPVFFPLTLFKSDRKPVSGRPECRRYVLYRYSGGWLPE
jgi:hypothetical protein